MKYRKKIVTKVIVIALRGRHRVTLIKPISIQNKKPVRRILFLCWVPQTVGYKTSTERFFEYSVHSQRNKEQSGDPQLFVLFSSSRYAMYFYYSFQTARSNELIFSGILQRVKVHFTTKEQTFWAIWLLRKVNKTVAKTSSRYARTSCYATKNYLVKYWPSY